MLARSTSSWSIFLISCLFPQDVSTFTDINISTIPSVLQFTEGDVGAFQANYTCLHTQTVNVTIKSTAEQIAEVLSPEYVLFETGDNCNNRNNFNISLRAHRLGKCLLQFTASSSQYFGELLNSDVEVIVSRYRDVADVVYRWLTIPLAVILNFGFGCQMDLRMIWAIIKKPIGPGIGLFCQYVGMPLLGFGLAKALPMYKEYRFGLFILACCPGGAASNALTQLFDGDLNLSVTMTFVSTMFSLGLMPLWTFLLGPQFVNRGVQIPFVDIVLALLTWVTPIAIGSVLTFVKPKWTKAVRKCVRPLIVLTIAYLLTFGIYINRYMFPLVAETPIILSVLLLPWGGFLLGLLIAKVCRQEWKQTLTIGLETGIQNAAIAVVILQFFFPQPDGMIATIGPAIALIFTPFPLYFLLIGRIIRVKCCKKDKDKVEEKSQSDQNQNAMYATEFGKGSEVGEPARGQTSFTLPTSAAPGGPTMKLTEDLSHI